MSEPTIYVGGFSGGVDSQAAALWMRRHYGDENVVLLNSEAGRNEHPLTVEHVKWYSENVHKVVACNPQVMDMGNGAVGKRAKMGLQDSDDLTFDLLATLKGRFPSRMAQFCTEHLKMAPQKRWLQEHLSGIYFERFTGKRRDESAARAGINFDEWDTYYDTTLHHPIADWTKKMCFEYVHAAGEKTNPLYEMGFNRVGCAPCINNSKDDIANWAARAPEMIDKVRQWEEKVGRTFFPPCVPGMELNFVDDVVRWAQTDRGGRQFPMYPEKREGCSSKYGLCE